ncbi:universal stress protein [Streptomyces sp. NPDC047123]|uniref:universal stress protein n=1 Tax=Streptomyces sp. NPDC047123 TaxID=3155622 RepID=UPI0033D1803E
MTERRVIVGVSGSLASLAALREAVAVARSTGSGLTAVHAWEMPEGRAHAARHPDRAWARHRAHAAQRRLDRAFEEALGGQPEGVRVRRLVVRGRAGAVLRDAAAGEGRLLVIGARAKARWAPVRWYVERFAPCPVVTAAPPSVPRRARRVVRRAAVADFVVARPGRAGAPEGLVQGPPGP